MTRDEALREINGEPIAIDYSPIRADAAMCAHYAAVTAARMAQV